MAYAECNFYSMSKEVYGELEWIKIGNVVCNNNRERTDHVAVISGRLCTTVSDHVGVISDMYSFYHSFLLYISSMFLFLIDLESAQWYCLSIKY